MDPCSTLFAGFFLLALILALKAIAQKVHLWSSTPGAFRRDIMGGTPETLTALGLIMTAVGGRFLPDLVDSLFYAPATMSKEQETTWGITGIIAPLVITIPLVLWLSSKREKQQPRRPKR